MKLKINNKHSSRVKYIRLNKLSTGNNFNADSGCFFCEEEKVKKQLLTQPRLPATRFFLSSYKQRQFREKKPLSSGKVELSDLQDQEALMRKFFCVNILCKKNLDLKPKCRNPAVVQVNSHRYIRDSKKIHKPSSAGSGISSRLESPSQENKGKEQLIRSQSENRPETGVWRVLPSMIKCKGAVLHHRGRVITAGNSPRKSVPTSSHIELVLAQSPRSLRRQIMIKKETPKFWVKKPEKIRLLSLPQTFDRGVSANMEDSEGDRSKLCPWEDNQ